jgi:hypothetical protein
MLPGCSPGEHRTLFLDSSSLKGLVHHAGIEPATSGLRMRPRQTRGPTATGRFVPAVLVPGEIGDRGWCPV